MSSSPVAKIIELVGTSSNGWEDVAQIAVNEAKKTYMESTE
jgi:flavin-binding protein dodecin